MIYEKQKRYIIPFDDVPTPRVEMPEIEVEQRRGSFTEVETGFSVEAAMKEAKRCLGCRRCLGCALCWAECKPEAIDFSTPDEIIEMTFDEVVLTAGQDSGFVPIHPALGFSRFADVITDLQFERMLFPGGPTGGLVLSPLDGEIPKRLAIVQGAASGGEDHLFRSLIFGVNASILALDRAKDLQAVLISPLCSAFKKSFVPEVEKIGGLRIVEGEAVSIERCDGQMPLVITYTEAGQQKQEEVGLVVILTKPKPSPDVEALGKKLEQPVIC